MFKECRKPDLTAPRFRTERYSVLCPALFTKFKKKYPEHKGIDYKKFKEVITTFNTKLWENVIECRDGVELPESLGHIFIGSCPPASKKKNYNYAQSKEHGVSIKHKNYDTDSFLAKIFYTNFGNKYRFRDGELWMFDAHRYFSRATSQAYRVDWKKYVQVDNFKHISSMYRKHVNRAKAKNLEMPIEEYYNEFQFD